MNEFSKIWPSLKKTLIVNYERPECTECRLKLFWLGWALLETPFFKKRKRVLEKGWRFYHVRWAHCRFSRRCKLNDANNVWCALFFQIHKKWIWEESTPSRNSRRFLRTFAMRERGPPSPHWWQGHKDIHSSTQETFRGQVFFHKYLIFFSCYNARKVQSMLTLQSFTKQLKACYEGNSSCIYRSESAKSGG